MMGRVCNSKVIIRNEAIALLVPAWMIAGMAHVEVDMSTISVTLLEHLFLYFDSRVRLRW